jgi:hypothetical protein
MSRYSLIRSPLTVVLLLGLLVGTGSALSGAQGPPGTSALSAVGTAFTYQGHLTQDGSPANGSFDLRFALYDDPGTGTQVGGTVEVEDVLVSDGVFTVELDFGDPFDGTPLWLEIGVRPGAEVGPYTVLSPRQRLSPAPYAAYATRASWAGLVGVPAGLDDGDDDTTYTAGTGLSLVGAEFQVVTSTVQLRVAEACPPGSSIRAIGQDGTVTCEEDDVGTGVGSGWSLTGNAGTVPGTNYLGTTDDVALELHVNGEPAWRLEPGTGSPNVIGGYSLNSVSGAEGATVGGGGRGLAINSVTASYGTVGGGAGNAVAGYAGAIGGGEDNAAAGSYAVVGGGLEITAAGNYAVVGGGRSNSSAGAYATVSGGTGNTVTATLATIGGGAENVVTATHGTVAGGAGNLVTGSSGTVSGGRYNLVAADYGTIAGGGPSDTNNPTTTNNRVYDDYGTIGGGGGNVAGEKDDDPTLQQYTTVAGGQDNAAVVQYATVGGGTANSAAGHAATVGGGSGNEATNLYATVGGGSGNVASGSRGVVAGGQANSAAGNHASVGGGFDNTVTGTYGTIPGGAQNVVSAPYAFAAGSQAHAEHQGAFVWSDSSSAPFASTGPDQFLISAAGGVGIGTDSPSHLLTVEGNAAIQGGAAITVGVIPSTNLTLQAPRAVYAVGDLLYVASYATNTLSIWNVSDPSAHALVGYTTFQLQGPVDLQVVGTRAYLASQNNNSLTVLDVSDPSNPSHVHDTNEHLGRPQGVHVSGKYAYVASKGRDNPAGLYDGLTVFDVTDAPAEIAATSFVTTYLEGTSDVFVSGDLAFVTSRDNNRLVVFDVSDPRQPTAVSYTEESLSEPVRVHVSGIHAYVVAEGAKALVVYDISNPAQIAYTGQITTGLSHPRSLYVSGDRAYVAYAGDDITSEQCGLAVLDISDPTNIAVLNVIDMSDWLMWVDVGTVEEPIWEQVRPKPVAVSGSGARIYVANERHDTVTIFEVNYLEAPAIRAGELQAAHLEVTDDAAVSGDLAVRGGLNVGLGGALVQGALSVEGPGDSYILGRLGIGPVSTPITVGESISDYYHYTLLHPTHQLDVDGEARFRVNDHNHLVLRSPNTGSDEDAYIDFTQFTYPDLITPSARIEFDAADPVTHTTGIKFATQGADDLTMMYRLIIGADGDVYPYSDNVYSLGVADSRWTAVYATNGTIQTSDGRLKDELSPLPYGLEEVERLRPVTFVWADGSEDKVHYGLVAQEVMEILPEVVSVGDDPQGTLGMNYGELVPVLIRAVQEQQDQIETQADQIAALEAHVAALEQSTNSGPGTLRLPGIAGLGGLLACGLVVVEVRRRRQRP